MATPKEAAPQPISGSISDNVQRMKEAFAACEDFRISTWRLGAERRLEVAAVYFETLTYSNQNQNFMRDALNDLVRYDVLEQRERTSGEFAAYLDEQALPSIHFAMLRTFEQAMNDVLDGKIVVFIDRWDKALGFAAGGIETRAMQEPSSETVIAGPHIGTVEDLKKNIGLLRSRLRTPRFKLEGIAAGGHTRSDIVYGYLDGVIEPSILSAFRERVSRLRDEEVLEVSYVEEILEEAVYSPFPQFRLTERPDTAVAALLEGKLIVMVQGSGSILICPGLFTEFFQANEDYYQRTAISSGIRLLRVFACGIALTLPGIYISLSSFHPELIPTNLLLAILDSKEGIPFPTFVEALIMQFFFELLREAGLRLPKPIGSAVSIVGALVIGEAAINAGIASPIMVVVVALTGIASFAIPQYKIAIAFRILQFPLLLLAASLGMFGMMIGMLWIVLHMANLRVLGQPYFEPFAPLRPKALEDVVVRAPLSRRMRSPRGKTT